MKKEIALMALAALTLTIVQQPCLADDNDHKEHREKVENRVNRVNREIRDNRNDWFDRHDRNHDNKWNYREFRTANQIYWRKHHDEHPWRSDEVKTKWNTLHENGYVTREKVKELHHWD